MQQSDTHILTSHAGSLPRPDELIAANEARGAGRIAEAEFQQKLAAAVRDAVRRQKDSGIDQPGDGEYGKAMGHRINYGAWWSYSFQRLSGLELAKDATQIDFPSRQHKPGEIALTSMADRRDRQKFRQAYSDPESGVSTRPIVMRRPICAGPVRYTGRAAIAADVANFKAALVAAGADEGFMTSIAPGAAARLRNEHYKSDEEFVFATADAMREEYKAILDAGFILQLDDPSIAENWDQIDPEPSVADYKKFTMVRVEALNHAIKGLPKDRIRFHLCWGSWHGPHVTDIAMEDIVDLMLKIDCRAYSFEAANVRHEHEWRVWETVKLPDGKIILPGIVSHATNVVEHPRLVAERIARFASVRRPRARHCRDRLRPWRPRPSADRLGQARSPGRRRRTRVEGAVAAVIIT
jgi:5-methyltetrahydropteroyltriglutamate--homocysteine methyltransferase